MVDKFILAVDQYLHSLTTFCVPFVLAFLLPKSDFSYVAYQLVLVSLYIGVLNSTLIYWQQYKTLDFIYGYYWMVASYIPVSYSYKYIYDSNLSFKSLDLIILYGLSLLLTEHRRKVSYLGTKSEMVRLLIQRIAGIILAIGMKLTVGPMGAAAVIFAMIALDFKYLKSTFPRVKHTRRPQGEDFRQLKLFVFSFGLAQIPVFLIAYTMGRDFFADAKIIQMLFTGGAFLLLPLETIVIRSNGLYKQEDYCKSEVSISLPLALIVLYLIIGSALFLFTTFFVSWMNFSWILLGLFLVTWFAQFSVTTQTIRLRSANRTKNQYVASSFNLLVSITLVIYALSVQNVNLIQTFAVYICVLTVLTALVLRWR